MVVSRDLNIPCSFTLEATFCGANYGTLKHCHMNIGHLQEVGASLCDAILNFAISEGYVKDSSSVPGNVKAVAQIVHAIALEVTHLLTYLLTYLLTHSLTHSGWRQSSVVDIQREAFGA